VEAKELSSKIADYLNTMGAGPKIKELVKALSSEHRTLQQLFTRVCIAWLQDLAEREHFDDRNKASVELARKIMKNLSKDDLYLPMI